MTPVERKIVQRYVELTIGCIRSVDPDRPIFSNRFMASGIGASASFLDLYARYDGIAVNLYPQNQRAGLGDNERAYLQLFHERSGKPVLVVANKVDGKAEEPHAAEFAQLGFEVDADIPVYRSEVWERICASRRPGGLMEDSVTPVT